MAAHIAILSTSGALKLPDDIQRTLGLGPGSQLVVMVEEGRLILEPLATPAVDLDVANLDIDAALEDLARLQGSLASRPGEDAVEQLQRERRQDRW